MQSEKAKIKKSLKYSIYDGSFAALMAGIGESFFSAFGVFLNANNLQLGLLGSLPQTLGSLSQLCTNRLIKWFNSRKKLMLTGAFLQALMYIPIALVFFFGTFRVYHLILFISLYWIFGSIIGPAWNSWMGDLVDEDKRGRYFGRRGKITGFVSFASFLIGGYILQKFASGNKEEYIGFMIIFITALIARLFSVWYLGRKYEPKYVVHESAQFSLIDFIKQARFRNYGLFVMYLCLMNFGVYLAGPFFTPYMLNDLKLSYTLFTIVSASATIVKILTMPIWGNLSDKYGNKKVLTLAAFLMPLVPIWWIFSTNIWWLIIIQMFSGFVWAGFEIASFNFIFDTTTPQKRATCVAYYNVLNGVAIISGAMIGGLVVRYNDFAWSKYYLVFILSFIFRYLASIMFIPKLKEVRTVEEIPYSELFLKIFTTMPNMGIVNEIITFTKTSTNGILEKIGKKNGKQK